jgi:hypothetical protein
MQRFSVGTGHRPIIFDQIHKNAKQSGRLKHIREAKEALVV